MENVIRIPGNPIAMQRCRKSKFTNKMYNPQKKEKTGLRWLVASQWQNKPIEGAVYLQVTFTIPMPRSWPEKRRQEADGKPHASKPDSDNLEKFLNDLLSGIVFLDDCQVSDTLIRKRWGKEGATVLKIKPVTDSFFSNFPPIL